MAWDEYQKDHSRANRGKELETFINFANLKYQSQGVAVMHKVPTEFIPIRGNRGQVVSCKVEGKSCADYLGHYMGIPVAVEAKSTKAQAISFSEVQDHQAAFLDDWMETGGPQLAFILVSFGMSRFYAVPWQFWKAGRDAWEKHKRTGEKAAVEIVEQYGWAWQTPGTASVKRESLLADWEIQAGGRYGLPYLQIIEKIAGGNTKNES